MAQFRTCALATGFWAADGAELLLIGAVSKALSTEWGLSAWQRSTIVSIIFIGMLTGNVLGGSLGDYAGRRTPILCAYIGIVIFSMVSALCSDFAMLCAVRYLVGISIGIGGPASLSLFSEACPVQWRMLSNGTAESLFTFGELYAVALIWLDDPAMNNMEWRRLLVLGALPSIAFGTAAWAFLHESPYYLAKSGDCEGALKVLEAMRDENGAGGISVDFEPPPPSAHEVSLGDYMRPLRLVFGPRMLYSTLVLGFTCFFLNMAYYGGLYAFPQMAATIDVGSSPVATLLIGTVWEFPGILLGVVCGVYVRRKPTIIITLAVTTLSMLAFVVGVDGDRRLLLRAGYIGIKVFILTGFVLVYQYANEVYTTEARATGTAASVAFGRIGSIVAPTVIEQVHQQTGSFSLFFYVLAALSFIGIPLMAWMPFETHGRKLDEVDAESLPLIPEVGR